MKLRFLTALSVLAACGSAFAEPTLYSPHVGVLAQIKNTTDSNLLGDEVDPTVIWVMPPNRAEAKVGGLHSKTANMGFCKEMRDLQTDTRGIAADIKKLSDARVKKAGRIEELNQIWAKLAAEVRGYAETNGLQALDDLDTRISAIETNLADLYTAANSCTGESCDQINADIRDTRKAKSEMLKERNKIASENAEASRQYLKLKQKADAAENRVKIESKSYSILQQELEATRQTFLGAYEFYGRMEGAKADFGYRDHWVENVSALSAANPGFSFQQVATKDAKLMTEFVGFSNIEGLKAILGFQAAGDFKDGIALYPSYPQSFTANIVLSLVGACPLEHPEYFDIKQNSSDDMVYGVMITYDYDTVFKVKASATYNMYKMYQKIVSSSSSRKWFKSSSSTSVVEKNEFKDSFNVTWSDQENTLTEDQRNLIEGEMLKGVMSRLVNIALPQSPNKGDVLKAADPGPGAGAVISETLIKTCPGNVYCVAGAVVFKAIDALFGGGSSTSSYTNIINAEITDNYERASKITKSAITSYAKAEPQEKQEEENQEDAWELAGLQ